MTWSVVFSSVEYVAFGTAWRTDGRYIPKAYNIEVSVDGTSWTPLVTVTDNTNTRVIHRVGVQAKWVRLTLVAPQTGQTVVSISGFQVLVNDGGALSGRDPWAARPGGHTILATSGNVGIGTADPAAKLTVSGINATVNIETAEIVRLLRPVVYGVKNHNSAGFRVGAFEAGSLGERGWTLLCLARLMQPISMEAFRTSP